MKLFISRLSLFFSIMFFSIVSAQESGEMLRFDKKPNLKMELTRSTLQKATGGVLYQSPINEKSSKPFNRVLFNGTLADTNLTLQLSYEQVGGKWTKWLDVKMKIFENGRFWARLDFENASSQRMKYRLLNRGISPPAGIEIYAVEGVYIKSIKKSGHISQPIPQSIKFVQIDTIPKPAVVTRQQWAAKQPIGNYIPHNPFRFAQHHTAGRRISTVEEGKAEQRFIQDFHQNGRGWQDIGYHFCVDDSGRIYEGVPPESRGTHTGGNNTGNIGISLYGNFEISGEFPTAKSQQSLVEMWSYLAFKFGVNPDSLFGHRDYKATACPGKNFYPKLADLRNGIRNQLGFGAPYLANPLPQPFTREISPNTTVLFFIKDDEEGVDVSSIKVRVNNEIITPTITGTADNYRVSYQPPAAFPSSQNVVVSIEAADLAATPNGMQYSYQFAIEVEALHAEVETGTTMRNAVLEIAGGWTVDFSDVFLANLTDGPRLLALDNDGSHIARIFPNVPQTGDYNIFMASNSSYLGESARYRFVNAYGFTHPNFIEYNSVYLRKWGSLSPTPVHFEAGNTSNAYIELSGLENLPTRLVLDAFRFEKVDRLDRPSPPTLKWVRRLNGFTNEIEVAWFPSLEGDIRGYRLFMSEDGRTWDKPLVDEETLGSNSNNYVLNYTNSSTKVYFKIVAVDTNTIEVEGQLAEPLLSVPTDTYGVGLQGGKKILVVDNFDRQASWQFPFHPFARSHGDALDANGYGFDSSTETAVQNGEIKLGDYDVVVYFCGDDSRSDESLAAADQFRLLEYLESGGKLFISGSEIGYDFDATITAEKARYENLLKAKYVGDLSGSNRVLGEEGTVFQGLNFIYGTMSTEDTYFEDFPDYIVPAGGSEVALLYDNLRIAAVQFTGTYGAGNQNAQLIYLGFTFETIINAEDRAALMERALNYFGLPTSVAGNPAGIPQQFELSENYPNPFNPTTTIRFTVAYKAQAVKLIIYDLLGRVVRVLADEIRTVGEHSVQWDGRNENGIRVASGTYLYKFEAKNFVDSKKMVMLK